MFQVRSDMHERVDSTRRTKPRRFDALRRGPLRTTRASVKTMHQGHTTDQIGGATLCFCCFIPRALLCW